MKSNILKIDPLLLEKVWGGTKLASIKRVNQESKNYGESIELSNLQGLESEFNKKSLESIIVNKKDLWGPSEDLDYLVKFLNANDWLSVQVHPKDSYVHENEKSKLIRGKNECWLVADCEENSFIYLGFKKNTNRLEIESALHQGDGLIELMNKFKLKKGQFYYIPAGVVHALGANSLMLEVQQTSGITYRLWDWNRNNEGRELHVEQGLNVLNYSASTLDSLCFIDNVWDKDGVNTLLKSKDFMVMGVNSVSALELEINKEKRPTFFTLLEGEIIVGRGCNKTKIKSFESVFFPYVGENRINITNVDTKPFRGVMVY